MHLRKVQVQFLNCELTRTNIIGNNQFFANSTNSHMTSDLLTGELISDLIYVGGSENEVIKTFFSLKVHKHVFCELLRCWSPSAVFCSFITEPLDWDCKELTGLSSTGLLEPHSVPSCSSVPPEKLHLLENHQNFVLGPTLVPDVCCMSLTQNCQQVTFFI